MQHPLDTNLDIVNTEFNIVLEVLAVPESPNNSDNVEDEDIEELDDDEDEDETKSKYNITEPLINYDN